MINLIPQSAKKVLLVEYWVRSFTVWMILWSIAFFIGAAILLPPYVLIDSQVSVYEQSALAASEKVANFKNVSLELARTNQEAGVIVQMRDSIHLSDYIDIFQRLQGEAIQITNISVSHASEGIRPASITGVATDRQSLAAFRDRLLAEEQVNQVDLPISNLAQDKDITFTITVDFVNQTDV